MLLPMEKLWTVVVQLQSLERKNYASLSKYFYKQHFWSERIGFAAAPETIKQMEKNKTWKIIKKVYILKILGRVQENINWILKF